MILTSQCGRLGQPQSVWRQLGVADNRLVEGAQAPRLELVTTGCLVFRVPNILRNHPSLQQLVLSTQEPNHQPNMVPNQLQLPPTNPH